MRIKTFLCVGAAFMVVFAADAHFAYSKSLDMNCKNDEDCTIVNSSCKIYSAMAIARRAAEAFEKKLAKSCKNQKGKSASLSSEGPVKAVCVKKKCTLQPM